MKKIITFTPYFLSGIVLMMIAGCATEKITADYVMPAEKISDVKAVNVVAIRVKTDLKGPYKVDPAVCSGLVKQLASMRLYQEGYYSSVDSIWGDVQGVGKLQKLLKAGDTGYGYALYSTEQGLEKVILDLELQVAFDTKKVTKEETFTLKALPYKIKEGKDQYTPATSEPDPKGVIVTQKKQPVSHWETTAKGTLKARFIGPDGASAPVPYENTFDISMPKDTRIGLSSPSFIKALAAAVSPAINGVIADISPHKTSRTFEANKEGNEKIVLLLNAKAFPEVIYSVDALREKGSANYADLENQGLAYEVLGD